MHFKKYVWVLCLFLFGMGFSFGQSENAGDLDSSESASLSYTTLKTPFIHKTNTWINTPNGYTALSPTNLVNVINKHYGISISDKAELVTIMVPNLNNMITHEPYIVVLYYNGLGPSKSELNGIDKNNIFEALQSGKNSKHGINWQFNDWILEETKFDKRRNLLKMNAFYTFAGEIPYPQRQIAYWQFGNKGTYHYVWICPEDKISRFQPPRTALDNLLGVLPSFAFEKPDESVSNFGVFAIEDIVCLEDLGPSIGIHNPQPESSENTNTGSSNNDNSELSADSISEDPEETYEEPTPTPAPFPVFGLQDLIKLIGQLSLYQLGGIIAVPIITTLFVFLFNNKTGKRKKKEVPWD